MRGRLHHATVLLCCALACRDAPRSKARTTESPTARILDPSAPVRIESLGTPVRASRAWTTALSPNPRGGWNFITHTYAFRSNLPSEFVVVDLATGTSRITEGPSQVYSAKGFQIANQLRAANGRIFFPQSDGSVAYYDPADEAVKKLTWHEQAPRSMIYSAVFGRDGKLYGGTQGKGLPALVQIDPETATGRVLGNVGAVRYSYSYAYQVAVDPPWIYAAVGQSPWELAAYNIETGESKVLATRDRDAWMKLEARADGVLATFTSDRRTKSTTERVWCVDGRILPASGHGKAPFAPRDAEPLTFAIGGQPELDVASINPDSNGVGRVRWRSAGETTWKTVEYRTRHAVPVEIESLAVLPDGTLLGTSAQYQGFFRHDPATLSVLRFPPFGPSRAALALRGDDLYVVGYPNGALYRYDPARPWTAVYKQPAAGDNPALLGHFKQSGTKYAHFLSAAGNGRLYYLGRRERDGIGSGIGSFDPTTSTFAGHSDGLNFLDPRGFLVLEDPRRVIVSGRLHPDPRFPGQTPRQAELVIFDQELRELERQIVKPNVPDTGKLYAMSSPGVIVGIIDEPAAIYRYDVRAKTLLAWKDLERPVTSSTQRSDGTLWGVVDSTLMRIDLGTLELAPFGHPRSLPPGASHLTWLRDDLYFTVGAELLRLEGVGIP